MSNQFSICGLTLIAVIFTGSSFAANLQTLLLSSLLESP